MDILLLIIGIILICTATGLVIYYKKHPVVYEQNDNKDGLLMTPKSDKPETRDTADQTIYISDNDKTEILHPEKTDQ